MTENNGKWKWTGSWGTSSEFAPKTSLDDLNFVVPLTKLLVETILYYNSTLVDDIEFFQSKPRKAHKVKYPCIGSVAKSHTEIISQHSSNSEFEHKLMLHGKPERRGVCDD
jgi:hypothetical protein